MLLTPMTAGPAFEHGRFSKRGAFRCLLGESRFYPYAVAWNHTGQPAASVPAGLSSEGLPLAVQIVGRPNDEGTLLSLAAQLERRAPVGLSDAAASGPVERTRAPGLGGHARSCRGRRPSRSSARPAAPYMSSRKSSECSGSWWKSSSRFASTRRAKVSVSVTREWPQPTWSGYSSSVYWQSWISRSAPWARSYPEIHSGSSFSSGAPSPGSWSEM